MSLQKKYPPYSKPLRELIKSGYAPQNDVNLFIGKNSWKKAENFSVSYPERTMSLPAWHEPSDYDWPVIGCSILVFETSYANDDYVNDVAYYLYQDGANIVRFISMDFEIITFNKGI